MKDGVSDGAAPQLPDVASLDTATLTLLVETGERELAERRKREREAFILEVRERSVALGLQLDELPSPFGKGSGKRTAKRTSKPAEPKYRNPDNDAQTWDGCGTVPQWLRTLQRQGHAREKFRIRLQ